ncbi:MAG: serine/threonine protein kinase [Planctomycetes bacterium]|nr:serine/threonine protein kinase [Planctomycetota bacterium]
MPITTTAPTGRRSDQLEPGQQVGSFTIEDVLHRSRDVTVLSAWQNPAQRVALKVLNREVAEHVPRVRAFYAEAKYGMQLTHPRLVAVESVGPVDGWQVMQMPVFEQRSLERQLQQTGPMTEPAVWRFAAGLAEALELVHRAGFLHRDVSPASILMHPVGWVLGGFSRMRDRVKPQDLAGQADLGGWNCYQAPELMFRHLSAAKRRSDIYSLGAVMAKCLFGRIPFETATRDECLAVKRRQSTLWLSDAAPGVSPETLRFLSRCLDPDPGGRPESLVELVQQASGILGQPVESLWPRLAGLVSSTIAGEWVAGHVVEGQSQPVKIPHVWLVRMVLRGEISPRTLIARKPWGPFQPLKDVNELRVLRPLLGE